MQQVQVIGTGPRPQRARLIKATHTGEHNQRRGRGGGAAYSLQCANQSINQDPHKTTHGQGEATSQRLQCARGLQHRGYSDSVLTRRALRASAQSVCPVQPRGCEWCYLCYGVVKAHIVQVQASTAHTDISAHSTVNNSKTFFERGHVDVDTILLSLSL